MCEGGIIPAVPPGRQITAAGHRNRFGILAGIDLSVPLSNGVELVCKLLMDQAVVAVFRACRGCAETRKSVGIICRKNTTIFRKLLQNANRFAKILEKVLCFYPIEGIMHSVVAGPKGMGRLVGKIQRSLRTDGIWCSLVALK